MSVELNRVEVAARAQDRQRPHDRPFSCARCSWKYTCHVCASAVFCLARSRAETWKNVSSSVGDAQCSSQVFFFILINLWLFVSFSREPGASSSEMVDCHRVTPSTRSRYFVGWPRIRALYWTCKYKI